MAASPLSPLLIQDGSIQFFYSKLTIRDIVKMTRVCKLWRESLQSIQCQSLWHEPLKICKIEIGKTVPYIKFAEMAACWHSKIKDSMPLLEQEIKTARQLDYMGYNAGFSSPQPDLQAIKEYHAAVALKFEQAAQLLKGFNSAMMLYLVNISDFSMLERYADKLEKSCGKNEIHLELSRLVYHKEGRIDVAEDTLMKAQEAYDKEKTISNADFKYKTLNFIVGIDLKSGNIEKAFERIKGSYVLSQHSVCHSLTETLSMFIDCAIENKRIDFAENLLELIKADKKIYEIPIWQSYVMDAKRETLAKG